MRAIKPETNERANFYNWYAPRSLVEITIPGWPRRQRFGHLMFALPYQSRIPRKGSVWPDLWICCEARIAFPDRFRMTNRSFREMEYFHVMTGLDAEKGRALHPEDMAEISDDEDLSGYGSDFNGDEFIVIEPAKPRVQRVARLVRI